MEITFHGVRGSTPCNDPAIARYGGNTSCVSVTAPGELPLLFDLGTGLRYFGAEQPVDRPFRGTCLLTHLHWDHLQGLPFFTPLLRDGSCLDVYAPPHGDEGVGDVFVRTFRPPLFPVEVDSLPGRVVCHDIGDDDFDVGGFRVSARLVPHVGPTCGYRVEWGGRTVAYLSDHQQPCDGSFSVTPGALELCRGADVLIHDAQYTPAEFARKCDWGHSMIEYAVWLGAAADVRTLVLFHHDPTHDDELIDVLAASAAACARSSGVEVVAAREGMILHLGS
ncbi:MAG: MBL fold metallo-hydrolase [Ilumatobacteraceae bacterium]